MRRWLFLLALFPLILGRMIPRSHHPSRRSFSSLDAGVGAYPPPPTSRSSHNISSLPGLSVPLEHYAGMVGVDPVNKAALFYWYFPHENKAQRNKAPFVVWINGGPGCTSMYGLFTENGPLRVDAGGNVRISEHSWHRWANLLFVDQPVGTGLSMTLPAGLPQKDLDYAVHFETILRTVMTLYPETALGSMYLSGESFAGHYLPAIAKHLLTVDPARATFKLAGLLIGNPWSDPEVQYPTYTDFAYGNGLVSSETKRALDTKYAFCKARQDCFMMMDDIITGASSATTGYSLNYYDVRSHIIGNALDQFPTGIEHVVAYLQRYDVLQAIHVAGYKTAAFVTCVDDVYASLAPVQDASMQDEFSFLLSRGVKVQIFSGQYDLICNHVGTGVMVNNIKWGGQKAFQAVPTRTWNVKGRPAGFAKVSADQLLSHVVVLNGGHMVLYDQPDASVDLIVRFTSNRSLADETFSLPTSPRPEQAPFDASCFWYGGPSSDPPPPTPTPTSSANPTNNNHNNNNNNNSSINDLNTTQYRLLVQRYNSLRAAMGALLLVAVLAAAIIVIRIVIIRRRAKLQRPIVIGLGAAEPHEMVEMVQRN